MDEQAGRRQFLLRLGLLAGAGAVPVAARALSAQGPRAGRLEVARPALGTWVRVVVEEADPGRASRAIERAFEAIGTVEDQMSIHRAGSEISRVNRAAGARSIPVSPAVLTVVERAREAAARTGGVYDPTVLPLMRLYGFYDSGRKRWPKDREIAATLETTGFRHVIVNRAAGTLGLARRGAAIDLGSIGKGWALDRAIEALRGEGIGSALVDVGGNVYGLGAPEGRAEGWTVGVLHPATGRVGRTFALRDRAVATSGLTEQFRILDHVKVGHILDARRGRPADGPLSVSVEARTGTESDLLSTVAFLLGPDRFRGYPGALQTHFLG